MAFCIPRTQRDKLKQALKDREISVESLYDMTSEERNIIFKKYVGGDFSSFVNGKFEQAMRSNRKDSLVNWVKQTTEPKDPTRQNMIKRIERNEGILTPDEEMGFLRDLAEQKLGVAVSEEEATNLINLKKNVDELKNAIPENSPKDSTERLVFGWAQEDLKKYIGGLKLNAEAISPLERLKPTNYFRNLYDFAGATKSMATTVDNSFIGRQGIKVLMAGEYRIWADTAVTTFKLFGKELTAKSPGMFKSRDDAIMRGVRAEVFSRPNALNGKYTASKNEYGLGVTFEEAFPSSLPERIPALGRLFKASETAFNGGALRMRADLADAVIEAAEKNGIDMLDERQATAFGKMVSSMTGRGDIGKAAVAGKEINAMFFSIRFLKSNFDTLTAHQFDRAMTPEARKAAAFNTLRIASSIGALLGVAKMLDPDSVDFDPRSSDFGKIKLGNQKYDITGGMAGLATLAHRVFPSLHNGEWGFWSKSASTGKYTKSDGLAFGQMTARDYFVSFFEGKLSPSFGTLRDVWRGQNFEGEKPEFFDTAIGLVTPISVEMLFEELEKGNDDMLIALMAEVIGVSPTPTDFRGYGVKWRALKENEEPRVYNDTLKEVTTKFNERAKKLRESPRWSRLSNEEQSKELDAIKRDVTNEVLGKFGL